MKFAATVKTYGVGDFKLPTPKGETKLLAKSAQSALDAAAIAPLPLPDNLAEIIPSDLKWVEVIVTGEDPPGKVYASRSERLLAGVCWMLANGVQPGHVLSILLDPACGIGAHVREKPDALRYGQRQVARALMMIEAKREDWPVLNDKLKPAKDHPANIRYALARLGVEVRRNLFTFMDDVEGLGLEGRDGNDVARILSSRFQLDLQFRASDDAIRSEIVAIAHEQAYHPIVDYFAGNAWDGTPRLDNMLHDYAGAEDTELNREFGAKFMIAGVRRVRQPGVKFDTMMVFEGNQGTGKSSFLKSSRSATNGSAGASAFAATTRPRRNFLQVPGSSRCRRWTASARLHRMS